MPEVKVPDYAVQERTCRYFVRGVVVFAAHVLVILLVLAWVFSDGFAMTTSLVG